MPHLVGHLGRNTLRRSGGRVPLVAGRGFGARVVPGVGLLEHGCLASGASRCAGSSSPRQW